MLITGFRGLEIQKIKLISMKKMNRHGNQSQRKQEDQEDYLVGMQINQKYRKRMKLQVI